VNILLLPKTVQHAIQIMVHISMTPKKSLTSVSKISEESNIPKSYLAKIVQILASKKLIKTKTGRTGGITLAKKPNQIKIIDIVFAINDKRREKEMCIIGIDECNDKVHCPLHHSWKKIKKTIYNEFSIQTLDILVEELLEKKAQTKSH